MSHSIRGNGRPRSRLRLYRRSAQFLPGDFPTAQDRWGSQPPTPTLFRPNDRTPPDHWIPLLCAIARLHASPNVLHLTRKQNPVGNSSYRNDITKQSEIARGSLVASTGWHPPGFHVAYRDTQPTGMYVHHRPVVNYLMRSFVRVVFLVSPSTFSGPSPWIAQSDRHRHWHLVFRE